MTGSVDFGLVLAFNVEGAPPLLQLAGLSLVHRTVLTMQRQGVTRIVVATTPGDPEARVRLTRDPRVRIPLSFVDASNLREALAAVSDEVRGRVLVASHDVVVDPLTYKALLEADLGDKLVAVVGDGLSVPFLASRELFDSLDDSLIDMESATNGLLATLAHKGEALHVDAAGRWMARVGSEQGREKAFNELFEACRKSVDGIVSRHLNRHVSIFISKRIVNTPITPNAVSIVTFLFGVEAAICVASGTYGSMLVGAVLFQINSILDGVDGELARVRFQQSKTGEWVDTVSDDVSNVLFYGALAIAASKVGMGGLAAMGIVAVLAALGTMALYYTELVRIGSGDFYALDFGFDRGPRRGPVYVLKSIVRYATKKDFFIFAFVIAALFGVLPYVLVAAMIGTLMTFGAGAVRTVKRLVRSG